MTPILKIIKCVGGRGGNGSLASCATRQRHISKPCGGNGGKGGNIILVANDQLNDLKHLELVYKGAAGRSGGSPDRSGGNANDTRVMVPIYTRAFIEENNFCLGYLDSLDKEFIAVEGGKGGIGSGRVHRALSQSSDYHLGLPGEELQVRLEYARPVDIAIIGLTNTGKSFLFNQLLSRDLSLVAPFPFTTTKCILGTIKRDYTDNLVIADTPAITFQLPLGIAPKIILYVINKPESLVESTRFIASNPNFTQVIVLLNDIEVQSFMELGSYWVLNFANTDHVSKLLKALETLLVSLG